MVYFTLNFSNIYYLYYTSVHDVHKVKSLPSFGEIKPITSIVFLVTLFKFNSFGINMMKGKDLMKAYVQRFYDQTEAYSLCIYDILMHQIHTNNRDLRHT